MELSQGHNVIDIIGKKYCPPSCLPCACLCLPEKKQKDNACSASYNSIDHRLIKNDRDSNLCVKGRGEPQVPQVHV